MGQYCACDANSPLHNTAHICLTADEFCKKIKIFLSIPLKLSTVKLRHILRESLGKMKAAGIRVLAQCITISVAAAASYSSYFYTSDNVAAAVIVCSEEVSQTSSQADCVMKCVEVRCYSFFWDNGACRMRRRGAWQWSGKRVFLYTRKVSFASISSLSLCIV